MRPTWATVDLDAIEHNVRVLRAHVAPAALCAVVKANAYGHGAVPVARAALAGGAEWLAVAFVDEGRELRAAGITAPMLVLSEPRPAEMVEARAAGLRVTVYSATGIAAAATAASDGGAPWPVQLKVDTGMHRVGCAPDEVVDRAAAIVAHGSLVLEGVWTHCAVADDPDDPFTAAQLARLDDALAELEARGLVPPMVHAANSAGGIAHEDARRSMVRAGIAIYGIAPSTALEGVVDLRPALALRSEVVHVQEIATGEGVSYGRRWRAARPTRVATVPIGYADGVRRSYGVDGGTVLVRGVRCPVLGVVTMDQMLVDVDAIDVAVGDEVVLIGEQGAARVTANDVAEVLGTIGYEVTCAISGRVPRRHVGGTP
jgi:alanine racemase